MGFMKQMDWLRSRSLNLNTNRVKTHHCHHHWYQLKCRNTWMMTLESDPATMMTGMKMMHLTMIITNSTHPMLKAKKTKTNQVEIEFYRLFSMWLSDLWFIWTIFDTLSGSDEDYSDKTSETQATKKKYSCKRQFICDFCGLNLSSKQRLLEHLLRHVKYMCQICSERYEFPKFSFKSWYAWTAAQCNKCELPCSRCISRRSLETHNKANHSAGMYPVCSLLWWIHNI